MNDVSNSGILFVYPGLWLRLTFMRALGQTFLPHSKIRQFYSIHVAFRFFHEQKTEFLGHLIVIRANHNLSICDLIEI